MIPTPTLTTERLLLRPFTLEDAESYARHFIDWDVIQFLSGAVPWPYPEDGVRDYLSNVILPQQGDGRWDWGLTRREGPDEVIGGVALWRPGVPENRGFWLGKAFWGQGLMTEAVTAIMDVAFDTLGFETLTFSNAVGNEASRRIKVKTGATLQGVEPATFVRPDLTEHEIWTLTREDWRARHAPDAS